MQPNEPPAPASTPIDVDVATSSQVGTPSPQVETPSPQVETPSPGRTTANQPLNRKKVVTAAVAVVGVFLMVSLIAILSIVLLTGSLRLQNESFSEYMVRIFTGSKSSCDDDPPAFEMLHSDWDGRSRKRGTTVNYRCGYVNDTPIARAVECKASGKWAESFKELKKCRLDPSSKKRFEKEEKDLTTIAFLGCTERDPPPPGRYFRDWNELQWTPGTVIKYYCSEEENSPIVMTVECRPVKSHYEWITRTRLDESCECPKYPPEYDDKKHLLNWEPGQRWIGTVIGYRCTNVYGSPYEKIYTCNVKKQWQVTEVSKC